MTERFWCLWLVVFALATGCEEPEPPAFSFYEDRIANVMQVGCVQQTTGCHVANERGAAVGNLDLSSYDALLRREDVLAPAGPYSVGQLLLKGGDPIQVPVQTFDAPVGGEADQRFVAITTDIRHAGGTFLREGSDGYADLKSWIAQGYRRDGSPYEVQSVSKGACRSGAGKHTGFDPSVAPADPESFGAFVRDVQPILVQRCAGSSCHGSPIADLYLSCGKSEAEQRWNYFAAVSHLDREVSLSELLRRPLSKQRGGTFHEGGSVFMSTSDREYTAVRDWAEALVKRAPELVTYDPEDPGLRFFGNYVQPMLVKKGCMFGNCHSPSMFHDLRLRTGSQGTFSRIAVDKNYEMARQQLSLASADPNQSRLIAKNLFPSGRGGKGLAHRGGALLEDFATPATPAACDGVDVTSTPLDELDAYCVLVAWHALEREAALARGEIDEALSLVWVSRPLGVGDPRDFDTYRPGADLRRADVTLDAEGRPSLANEASLLAGCGLAEDTADVRGPAGSWDGEKLAFAARSAENAPFRVYQANADGSACAPLDLGAAANEQAGIRIHDFDPAFAPDGRLVFASTRGNIMGEGFSYEGPTRTPSELAPNANLYVFDPEAGSTRQLTFLLNQEMQPSFMVDGRVIFTTEKREPDFFQLAGRRQNLDGGDYHPLFAQRDSVGFQRATEIVELPNRNLAIVAAPADAKEGAGTIAIVNRSIGPDQDDRDPKDLLYLGSLTFPAPGAFGRGQGAYRSPAALPSPFLIGSCAPMATNLTGEAVDFDLCTLDPSSGAVTALAGSSGRADIEAVALFARDQHGVFRSRIDEANGNTQVDPKATDAEILIQDVPLLATLMFENTRTGRPIDPRVGGFDLLEAMPPPADATSFAGLGSKVVEDAFGSVYVDYQELGHVSANADGSARIRIHGGHPVLFRLTSAKGDVLSFAEGGRFQGDMVQREQMQFYPGERSHQSFPRPLFNGMCGGCHGSITGFELDVAVDVDVLTHASETEAHQSAPDDLR